MKKQISNVFLKGIFGYLLRVTLRVNTYSYNYVPTSITGSFSFTGSLVVTSRRSCALTKTQNIGCSFKFPVKVNVEKSIVHAPLVSLQSENIHNAKSEVRFKQLMVIRKA
jgi:hypothetical protein